MRGVTQEVCFRITVISIFFSFFLFFPFCALGNGGGGGGMFGLDSCSLWYRLRWVGWMDGGMVVVGRRGVVVAAVGLIHVGWNAAVCIILKYMYCR